MKRVSSLLLLACILLASCALEASKPEKPFPIKIGLLADSQITSQNGFSDFHFRSKSADKLVDVSIRPPALESALSKEMLQIALNKLTQDSNGETRGVDIILYLGDAANSGGADEIEAVLAILAKHREQTGVPVFIINGNHDYLGAGNITSPGIRFAMLNRVGRPDNPALTKYEVLKKFSEFNHANNRLAGYNRFQYVDNADALERNKNLDHDTGLYLSGVVTYTEAEKARMDIFLLDSSDYKDAPDWSAVAGLGFYGVIGSISFKDEPGFVSQTSYLKQFALSSQPDFRFLASHYPKDHLDRVTLLKPGQVPLEVTNMAYEITESALNIPTFSKTLNQNLVPLLSTGGENYWVSGHTHVASMPRPGRFILGGINAEKYFKALNVGSTTDYRAHVAIVEQHQSGRNQRLDNFIGYREIPLFDCNESLLVSIPEAIGAYGKKHADDPLFERLIPSLTEWNNEAEERAARSRNLMDLPSTLLGIFSKKRETDKEKLYWIDIGATILGLNKSYQQDVWTDLQTEASDQHLRNFVTEFVDHTGSNRADVSSYLGLLSGAYEKGLLPIRCDFDPECLKQLCTDPQSPPFSKLPQVELPFLSP